MYRGMMMLTLKITLFLNLAYVFQYRNDSGGGGGDKNPTKLNA